MREIMSLSLGGCSFVQGALHGECSMGWISVDTHHHVSVPLCRVHLVSPYLMVSGSWSVEVLLGTNVSVHHGTSLLLSLERKSNNHPEFELGEDLPKVTQLLEGRTEIWEPSNQTTRCIDLRHPLTIQSSAQGPAVLASPGSFKEMQNFRLCPRPTDSESAFLQVPQVIFVGTEVWGILYCSQISGCYLYYFST